MAEEFLRLVRDLRDGRTEEELSDALKAIVQACRDVGKEGKLTFEITVKPEGRTAVVKTKINAKMPEAPSETSVFFMDEKTNALARRDPRQLELTELREVANESVRSGKEASYE